MQGRLDRSGGIDGIQDGRRLAAGERRRRPLLLLFRTSKALLPPLGRRRRRFRQFRARDAIEIPGQVRLDNLRMYPPQRRLKLPNGALSTIAGPVIAIQDVSAICLAGERKVPHRLFVFSIQKMPCRYFPDKRKLVSDLSRCTGNPWRYLIILTQSLIRTTFANES